MIRIGTASIIEDDDGRILLTKRNKEPLRGYWVLPGGGIKFGERIEDALKREIKEETGLNIDIRDFITHYEIINKKSKVHRIIFYYKSKSKGGVGKPSDDTSELKWIYPKDVRLMERVAQSVLDILKIGKYL